MEQRYLIVIDEQPQKDRLYRISKSLMNDGIELVYTEIDPSRCTKRQANGDVQFDMDVFSQTLKDVPFINHVDVFATDYNLIDNLLKGASGQAVENMNIMFGLPQDAGLRLKASKF